MKLDLTGKTFGKLKVIKEAGRDKRGCVLWECECQCKQKTVLLVRATSLNCGLTKSCGCLVRPDLQGQRFGRLTAIERAGNTGDGRITWRCVCDCGKEIEMTTTRLMNGNVKSCGCLRKNRKDIKGMRSGRLVAIKPVGKDSHGNMMWHCECDCGGHTKAKAARILSGRLQSCGCLNREVVSTHGLSRTRLYAEWTSMRNRCEGIQEAYVKYYQNRGITVCDEWKDSFEPFRDWALSHGYTEDLTLDRIDVNKGYSPDNCRWATRIQQANNRTDNKYLTFNGETKTATEWARAVGIKPATVLSRLKSGWSVERTLTTETMTQYARNVKTNTP